MSNTLTGINASAGPLFYDPNSDGAYLGANSFCLRIFNRTANYSLAPIHCGHIQVVNSATGVTVTLPANLPVGFNVRVLQTGAGAVTFTAAAGATVTNRQSYTKTAGAGAEVRLVVIANVDGASAQYILSGDGAL
jgi:hypothetical protein